MNSKVMHGTIEYPEGERHTDYLYRISLKAIVVNPKGEVLLVKESNRDWWDFPGGGIDHGETIKEGLIRELHEEVSFVGDLDYEPVHVSEPHVIDEFNITQIRLTFLVKPDNYTFTPGEDADEIMFVDPETFKHSQVPAEQKIYKYSQLALARLA